jgi:hypothetical protein
MKLVEYLKWPLLSIFSINMTKKVLREILEPDKKEEILSNIEKMTWAGALKSNHVQLPTFVNEEFSYEEIIFVEVILREKTVVDKVAKLLQRTIPYPLIIGFVYDREFCFQIAEKTNHKTQKDKRVVNQEKFFFSEWLEMDLLSEKQNNYLSNLAIDKVGGFNLKEYFEKLIATIYDKRRQVQIAIKQLEKEGQILKNQYSKEKNIAKKSEISTKARALAEKIKELQSGLKE